MRFSDGQKGEKDLKRLLIVGTYHDLCMGGVEQYLVNMLHAMDLSQYDVEFLIPGKIASPIRKSEFEQLGCKIIVLGLEVPDTHASAKVKALAYSKLIVKINGVFRNKKYDVIHINSGAQLYMTIVLLAATIWRIPIRIAHAHNIARGGRLRDMLRSVTPRLATELCACSTKAAETFFGRASAKTRIMKNAINTARFAFNQTTREVCRAELGIPKDALAIGHVGRFEEQKNHEFLVEVFREMTHMDPNAILLLLGEGKLQQQTRELLRQYGIDRRALFVGAVQDTEKYYCAMDVFVLPSLYEGLGIVNIEAQASGLTCIVSEGVPKDTDVSGRVQFIPLGDAQLWARQIQRQGKVEINRMDAWKTVAASGYEVSIAADELRKLYEAKPAKYAGGGVRL